MKHFGHRENQDKKLINKTRPLVVTMYLRSLGQLVGSQSIRKTLGDTGARTHDLRTTIITD